MIYEELLKLLEEDVEFKIGRHSRLVATVIMASLRSTNFRESFTNSMVSEAEAYVEETKTLLARAMEILSEVQIRERARIERLIEKLITLQREIFELKSKFWIAPLN